MCELIFMKIGGPNKVILRVKNQDANIKRIEIKLSNLCFLTGYQTLIGERKFYALGSSLEISQGYLTAYVIIYGHQKMKVDKFEFDNTNRLSIQV